ncbi:MAG: class I SAM-dependent methyltransferase [Cyanobacteria bacterium]|nr:class I SAM-dependent methyltransferase [Cyanobacteriota bacterium]
MSNRTLGLGDRLYEYLLSVSLREPEILSQLRQETAGLPGSQMQIAPEQGQFMALLLQLMGAQRVLEIGTFTGYSALAMAIALPPEGHLITCDLDAKATAIAQDHWARAGLDQRIELRLGPAIATLDRLRQEVGDDYFDFVFIDADKGNYLNYYEKALPLVRPNGAIAIDNVLWHGQAADSNDLDKRAIAIRAFNQHLAQDQRIDLSLIPIADGLTLARKRTGDRVKP